MSAWHGPQRPGAAKDRKAARRAEAEACECGKVRYLTRKGARAEARTFRRSRGKLRAYRCDGGFWHLTSQSTEATTRNRDFWRAAKADGR